MSTSEVGKDIWPRSIVLFDSQLEQFPVNAGAPHNGLAWLSFRIKLRISAATFGLPGRHRDFRVRTTRTLGGAKRSPYRGARCADYSAHKATIARARPTRAGRSAGNANEAARSFRER